MFGPEGRTDGQKVHLLKVVNIGACTTGYKNLSQRTFFALLLSLLFVPFSKLSLGIGEGAIAHAYPLQRFSIAGSVRYAKWYWYVYWYVPPVTERIRMREFVPGPGSPPHRACAHAQSGPGARRRWRSVRYSVY